jgi:quercetin dioxygenase-like cupin family protein
MKRCVLFLFLTVFLTAQAAQEVEITGELHHRLVLANDQVRVFNVEIPAHAETLLHWHPHDYIYVTLGHSQVVNTVKGKDPVNLEMQDGQTGFLAGGFAHIARNLSAEPYRNVTIELLQEDKLRHAPTHWDAAHPEEDRGLDILNSGTREILFVKDGVRVSEVELQLGGVIPRHHHAGPHLVVALTDYELRSDVEGKGSETITMKRGESRWTAGGYSHSVTNRGQHPAKFITLEFR